MSVTDLQPIVAYRSDCTVTASLLRHAAATPDRIALIGGNLQLTYAQAASAAGGIAARLLNAGVRPGDRVCIPTDHPVHHLIGVIGTLWLGAIAVPLPADQLSSEAVMADCEPVITLEDLELQTDADHGTPPLYQPQPHELAMFLYTSGTTSGVRKGVMQSYLQLHNTVHYITAVMKMDPAIREYIASPVDTAFWYGRCRCVIHVGGTAVLATGRLNPHAIVGAVDRYDLNAISGDTPIFLLLLHHLKAHLTRIGPKLRWVKIASAPLNVADKREMLGICPNAHVVFNYGLTEAMRTCLNPLRDNPEKLESVGRPSPSVEVCVADTTGQPVKAGEIGEVLIRGGNLASGYWKKDEMWRSRFHGDWYRSGDLGYRDEDGFVFLKGRIDHAINSGGKTIALAEVEARLRPFFTKTSFAACGMNDPKGILGDVVVLGIEGTWQEPLPWNELRTKMFEAVEPTMVPVAAFVVPELPRTANQKVQLNKLREAIEAGHYEAI
jgi:long-chain acyl-CoA synthetase